MANYSVLLVNSTGLFSFAVKDSIRTCRPAQIRKFISVISKSGQCPMVIERINQLEAEATSAEHGLDFMKFAISLAHECLPVSVTGFREVIRIVKLNDFMAVHKLVNFPVETEDGNRNFAYPTAQGRFIYKLKSELYPLLGEREAETEEGADEYEDVCYQLVLYRVTEEKVKNASICDTPWESTSSTSLKIFRGRLRRKEYFAATNGRDMEMNAEPCKSVIKYFRSWNTKKVPTLYLDEDWIEGEEDRALSILFEMLQLVYDNRPVPVDKKNIIILNDDI